MVRWLPQSPSTVLDCGCSRGDYLRARLVAYEPTLPIILCALW